MTDPATTGPGDRDDPADAMAPVDPLGATRHRLLSLYPPDQVAAWLSLHADADPHIVARKAMRLREHTPLPRSDGQRAEASEPPPETSRSPSHELPEAPADAFASLKATARRVATERPVAGQPDRAAPRGPAEPSGDTLAATGPSTNAIRLILDALPTTWAHADLRAQEIVTAALRKLFACEQPEEVQTALLEVVHRLGGRVARAADAGDASLPIDVSLGVGDPLLVVPAADSPRTSLHLRVHLPQLVEDARQALDRLERRGRLTADAEHDALTGLLNRRAYERLAGRLRPGAALVLLDLDDFKTVNDTHGHLTGDQVLRVFGSVLRDQVRITEHAIRLGGDEFLIVLEEPGDRGCELLLERLAAAWRQRRPLAVSFSAGTAVVATQVEAAMEAADRALYGKKWARAAAAEALDRV